MTHSPAPKGPDIIRGLEAVVTENAAAAERARTLPAAVVDDMWDSGLLHWMNPAEARGSEPSMLELIDTWQEMARIDGSFGWIGIANLPSTAFAAAYLDEQGFKEVFEDNDCRVTMGGQFAPNGMGNAVDGGYRVSGAWSFGSGSGHSQYVCAGFIPMDGDSMRMMPEHPELPEMLVAVIPRDEINFTDNWHVTGLKSTGSYDYNVQELLVPEHRTYRLFSNAANRGGSNYRLGVMPLTGAGHAAWALGVARSALDDIVQLAGEKTRMGDPTTLGNKLTFQRNLAHHEGMWRAARAGVVEAYTAAEAEVAAGKPLSVASRAYSRMAATYATEAAREIVQFAHLAAGTTAIREGSRLERAFRDMYTGTQHAFINERTYTEAGAWLLGLIEDSTAL